MGGAPSSCDSPRPPLTSVHRKDLTMLWPLAGLRGPSSSLRAHGSKWSSVSANNLAFLYQKSRVRELAQHGLYSLSPQRGMPVRVCVGGCARGIFVIPEIKNLGLTHFRCVLHHRVPTQTPDLDYSFKAAEN